MTLALPAMRNHNMMYVAVVIFLGYLSISAQNVVGNQATLHEAPIAGAVGAEPK